MMQRAYRPVCQTRNSQPVGKRDATLCVSTHSEIIPLLAYTGFLLSKNGGSLGVFHTPFLGYTRHNFQNSHLNQYFVTQIIY
jgi:hypothetical protein